MRDMRLERPPAPFGQNAEIAARLRRLDHAEARLAAGMPRSKFGSAVIWRKTPEFGPPL
jgi:hypothetical protein